MDFKQIQSMIRHFEKSNLTILEIETENFKLRCSKNTHEAVTIEQVEKTKHAVVPQEAPKIEGYEVKSPLVGTFYASNNPKANPFVEVGQVVKVGQTLCIIEAMKTMNEITSPVAGTIKAVLAKNEEAVGYDQLLMVIETV